MGGVRPTVALVLSRSLLRARANQTVRGFCVIPPRHTDRIPRSRGNTRLAIVSRLCGEGAVDERERGPHVLPGRRTD